MSLELINKYENPEQVSVVKNEVAKLSDHDKALYTAECVEDLVTDIKVTGWKKWLLKAGIVIIPLILGAILGKYFPDVATMFTSFIG